jgi:hypothetical protein
MRLQYCIALSRTLVTSYGLDSCRPDAHVLFRASGPSCRGGGLLPTLAPLPRRRPADGERRRRPLLLLHY